jgi:biopolymer transport protein ExbB
MITTLVAFQRSYPTAAALSAGMEQALLATAGGLMLAIPAHLARHFLQSRVRAIVHDVEWSANEIMLYLLTEYRSAAPAP